MVKQLFGWLLLLAFSLPVAADKRSDSAENLPKADPKAEQKSEPKAEQKNEQKAPLFKDGKGYYSYKKPLAIPLPQDKVLIHYFYRYDCETCLNGDDYLRQYAARNADKVVLVRSPAFDKDGGFTAQMNAAFELLGRPELSDQYLFDSANRKAARSLVHNNDEIKRWLTHQKINIDQFHKLFESEQVKQKMAQDRTTFQTYSPPITPIAVLDGKYILIHNTLYNDDYTYAVLDFLVAKRQQEKQQK